MATNHIPAASGEQIMHSPARQGSFVIEREGLTITHARYAAGEHVAGRHIHHQHTDAFYILEGEVIFEIGPEAEPITVSAGGFVAAPPGLTCGRWRGSGGKIAKKPSPVVSISSPPKRVISARTAAWCRSSSSAQAASPSASAVSVEPTMSVNRLLHSATP
jgi:uncharacterized RmlC-like cupin family protein